MSAANGNGAPRKSCPEAEAGVVSCVAQDPARALAECQSKLRLGGGEFDDLRNRSAYELFAEVWEKGRRLDQLVVRAHCEKQGQKALLDYVLSVWDAAPSPANLPAYLAEVQAYHLRRQLWRAVEEVRRRLWVDEVDDLLDFAESEVLAVRGECKVGDATPIKELVRQAIGKIEAAYKGEGQIGVPTGFADLDKLTGGMQGGQQWVVAALSGFGKTSFVCNIAEHVTLDSRVPAAIFSFEMSSLQLTMRMLAARARVNLRRVREGFLAERDLPKLANSAASLANAPLFIEDAHDKTAQQVRARARRLAAEHGVRVFVVDYLQLVDGGRGRREENREQEVARVSKAFKSMAMELDATVLALSQLTDEGKLRESRAIGHDADLVAKLRRLEDKEHHPDAESYVLELEKQREGPSGKDAAVYLTFLKPYTRFESAARVREDEK